MDHAPPAVDSLASYHAALHWGVAQASARSARTLWCVDEDFADWPWNQPELLQALVPWLRLPQRRLVLVARQFDTLQRRHPRFVAWRADWAHAVDTWAPSEGERPVLPADDGATLVHRLQAPDWRVSVVTDAARAQAARGEVQALLARCESAFPVKALGL